MFNFYSFSAGHDEFHAQHIAFLWQQNSISWYKDDVGNFLFSTKNA